jgi:hypothetical protein
VAKYLQALENVFYSYKICNFKNIKLALSQVRLLAKNLTKPCPLT